MKYGLSDATVRSIRDVLARHPEVEQAILYGSRAKGNYRHGSDIDLTLRGGVDLTWRVLYTITDELDDLLLPYTIDVSIFQMIQDADVVAHILRAGVVFYDRTHRALAPTG